MSSKITVNGKVTELEGSVTLSAYVISQGGNPRQCVIELNGKAMCYVQFCDRLLAPGDTLEIITIVAGG